jgi:hypothetical protein
MLRRVNRRAAAATRRTSDGYRLGFLCSPNCQMPLSAARAPASPRAWRPNHALASVCLRGSSRARGDVWRITHRFARIGCESGASRVRTNCRDARRCGRIHCARSEIDGSVAVAAVARRQRAEDLFRTRAGACQSATPHRGCERALRGAAVGRHRSFCIRMGTCSIFQPRERIDRVAALQVSAAE